MRRGGRLRCGVWKSESKRFRSHFTVPRRALKSSSATGRLSVQSLHVSLNGFLDIREGGSLGLSLAHIAGQTGELGRPGSASPR